MLILSRKPGDAIIIDGGIRVVVLGCDGSAVRLGIDAPRSVGIVREEIVHGIADENLRAGATPDQRDWLERLQPSGDAEDALPDAEGPSMHRGRGGTSGDPSGTGTP